MARTIYTTAEQVELRPLRELIERCEPRGLAVERNHRNGKCYRIVDGEAQPLTEFTTFAKLALWMDGFEARMKFNHKTYSMKQPTMLDKIKQSGAVSEQQSRLLGFLIEDVRSLVNAVKANDELASIVMPDESYGDMESFALYWDNHLKTLER